MASTRIFALRHTIVSVAILLLTSGTAIGVLGVASAEEPEPQGTFTFAEPMAGDHARYHVTADSGEGRPWDQGGDAWGFTFTWEEDRRLRLGDGSALWTNTVTMHDQRTDAQTAHVRAGTVDTVAYSYYRLESTTDADGQTLTVEALTLMFFEREAQLPCGFRTALQGQTIPVARDVYREAFDCRASGIAIDAGDRLTILGHGEAEGAERVLVRATNDREGEHMFYWYEAGIPYPVRAEEWENGALHRTWVMTGFARGDGAIRSDPAAEIDPLPELQFRPRTPWGLDASGVDHTFPPDEAWQIALEHESFPDLRDFLATHPDAYTSSGYYGNLRSDGRSGHWDYWDFDVTDGVEVLDFSVRRITDVDETSLVTSALGTDVSYDFSSRLDPANLFQHPTPDMVPDLVPTWASLLAVWDVLKSDAYPEQGNYYSFGFRCNDCGGVADEHYYAGFNQYDRTYATPNGPPIDDYRVSDVFWRNIADRDDYSLDRPEYLREQTQAWREPGQPAPRTAASQSTADIVTLAVAPGWSLPPLSVTAAATSVGLLLAATHWLWPLIKTGVVGLFSRVRQDRLLEHPVRSRIMAEIAAHPGIHQTELVRVADVGKGATEMHLRRLKAGGLITVAQGKGYTCYFAKGAIDRRVIDAAPVMKSKVARALVQYVHARPGVRATELRAALNISPSTLHYHMKRLEEAGVIEVRPAGNGKVLDLTHTGRMVAAS